MHPPILPSPAAPQVLSPARLAGLAGLAGPPPHPLHHGRLSPAAAAAADAARVARYALRRCDAVGSLLHRLATLQEMVELARATGLTLQQVGAKGRGLGLRGDGEAPPRRAQPRAQHAAPCAGPRPCMRCPCVGCGRLQAVYNAQMVRTNSLLLRTARRQRFLVPGRQESQSLQEHTFIMHPVDAGALR